ncbi:MAG: ribonuclease H family protein [Patescibacteria group bacterium]|nr:ribonuclease H family protein [Patescibacteria group bacterium]
MSKSKKSKFYAYFIPSSGKNGVTSDWAVTEKMVKGVTGARFKAFDSKAEAEAWLEKGAIYEAKQLVIARPLNNEPGIYFDAGTGRGEGVEISVTDENGKNLLHKVVDGTELNKFGKHLVAPSSHEASKGAARTNNYGELLALRYALEIAKKMKVKNIFGDSRLVIDYWSQWRIKRKELPVETVALAAKVAKMREQFEAAGGTVGRIPGGHNPADLGFHRP